MSDSGTLQLQLLDRQQAAQFLNISHRRLGDPAWRQRFHVPTIHVGGSLRFDRHELQRWLATRRERAA